MPFLIYNETLEAFQKNQKKNNILTKNHCQISTSKLYSKSKNKLKIIGTELKFE